MKIVIDIPEEIRNDILTDGVLYVDYEPVLRDAIKNGIPLSKGHWIQVSPAKIYECSECGQPVMTGDIEMYHFCHGCGADMRGEE